MENRIDKVLVERNLVPSRAKSQEIIANGFVKVNGKQILKANYQVKEQDIITIEENDALKYVSRAGLKLEKAIKAFDLDFKNKYVMDIGSSTGGFTDCALRHGAKKVIAIDVGTDLMDKKLRASEQVELHEQTNIKTAPSNYFEGIDIVTTDVSFISIKRIIDKIKSENIMVDFVGLIKPQFECGKDIASKYKGIILNKKVHAELIMDVINYFKEQGFCLKGISSSPIRGGDGNVEYVTYFSNKDSSSIKFDVNVLVNKAFKGK